MKTIGIICGLLTIVSMSGVAEAKRERDRERRDSRMDTCKPMLKERGDRATTEAKARENAVKAWEIAAKNSYGVPYAKSENAWTDPDSKIDNPNCYDDKERWLKKWECTWEAKPCLR